MAAIAVFMGLYGWARDMGHKPYPNKLGRSLVGWVLLSTAFSAWLVFPLLALRVPLVLIAAPAAVGGVILIYSARPRRGHQGLAAPSEDNHK